MSMSKCFCRVALWAGFMSSDLGLEAAALSGYTDIIKDLLKDRAEVRDRALMLAASKGYADIVRALLEDGAGANAENNDDALMLANHYGHTETAAVLEGWMAREKQKPSGPTMRLGMT